MKTKMFALAFALFAALSMATAQLAPAQSERASAYRTTLELMFDDAELMSLSLKSPASMAAGSGGSAGKASFSDLSFTVRCGKASPLLAKKVVRGTHFPTVVITVRKAGKEQHDYYKIILQDVTVTRLDVQPNAAGGRPLESISMNYTKIEFEYKPQK